MLVISKEDDGGEENYDVDGNDGDELMMMMHASLSLQMFIQLAGLLFE